MEKRQSLITKSRAAFNRFSIRSRIFCYFLLFTALLLILLWLFQTVLLNDFYKYQKTSMLTSSAESIAKNIENADIGTLITHISEQNDVCIMIVNESLEALLSVDASLGCVIHRMSRQDLFRFMHAMENNDEMIFEVFSMRSFQSTQYEARRFAGRVPPQDDGTAQSMIAARRITLSSGQNAFIFLNAIITPVSATVQTLRTQLIFITVVLIILSFFISLLLSKRITQPIVATTLAARDLSVGAFTPVPTRTSYPEITELNAQLTKAAADLRKVEAMQRELIGNISHDLRTPLTLIEGYAEVMRDLPGENSPENLQVVIDETKRLTTLVNAVLDYSVSKSGQSVPDVKNFDLTESILEILNRYQKLTKQEGYQVNFHYDAHVTVCADELKVSQVVYNLINNALTYTGEDQTVTVSQVARDGQVEIQIHDSGQGIAKDELPYIWSRYYRGSKPHKRATMGTGLGLSIVQGILESHQLSYGVSSEEGAGTTFWFRLPIQAWAPFLPGKNSGKEDHAQH